MIQDAQFTDLSGKNWRLSDFQDRPAVVLCMTSTSCPLSQKYLPSLATLATDFADRRVAFILVNPFKTDENLADAAMTAGSRVVYVHDQDGALARAIGAATTTDAIVLDAARTVVYQGAVDDQYGFGYSLDAPRQKYLAKAVDSVLAGRRPMLAATTAPGCVLDLGPPPPQTDSTYHNRISRILQFNCLECHREGGAGPFSLDSLDAVSAHSAMIEDVLERGAMPPWFAASAGPNQPSPWITDRSLSGTDRTDLLAWLKGGMAAGNERDAPLPLPADDGWAIGMPDHVFQIPEPIAVKATGTMPYQNAVVETNLSEDRWVQAIEVRPTARAVVHHVLVFVDGVNRVDNALSGEDPGDARRGFFAVYVPGNSVLAYPDGYAKRLPKNARLRFQIHYTPNGKATTEQCQVGLVFAKEPPEHEVHVAGIVNPFFRIPPGEPNYEDSATLPVPFDARLMGFLPHMHLRGKAARYELIGADGSTETLLDVPRYDFNWQLVYRYFDPLLIPQGSKIKFTAWFDNSADNPANPDPTKTVRWGPQTYEEMLLGYVEFYIPGQKPGSSEGLPAMGAGRLLGDPLALFALLDQDKDDTLSKEELEKIVEFAPRLKENPRLLEGIFGFLDQDSNGKIEKSEFGRVRGLRRN
jgi:thiol-disulfide isomerase/thioredoxin